MIYHDLISPPYSSPKKKEKRKECFTYITEEPLGSGHRTAVLYIYIHSEPWRMFPHHQRLILQPGTYARARPYRFPSGPFFFPSSSRPHKFVSPRYRYARYRRVILFSSLTFFFSPPRERKTHTRARARVLSEFICTVRRGGKAREPSWLRTSRTERSGGAVAAESLDARRASCSDPIQSIGCNCLSPWEWARWG